MTLVRFAPPGDDGTPVGYIEGRPVGFGDLPDPFRAVLVDGEVVRDVTPSLDTDTWCWNFTERVDYGRDEYARVPDAGTAVDYDDLVKVDGDDFSTTVTPSPAWAAGLDAALAAAGEASDAASDALGLAGVADGKADTAIDGLLLRKVTHLSDLARPLGTRAATDVVPVISTTAPAGLGTLTLSDWTSGRFHFTATPTAYAAGYCFFKTSDYASTPTTFIEAQLPGARSVLRLIALVADTVQVFADDQPLWATPQVVVAGVYYIDLPYAARNARNIRIATSGNSLFGGMYTGAFDLPFLPPRRFRLGLGHDSYSGHQNSVKLESPGYAIALATGFDVYELAQPSTGYCHPGTGGGRAPYGDPTRTAYLTTYDIDALLVVGSVNDAGFAAATVQAAAAAYYAWCQANRPDMPLMVAGVEPLTPAGGSKPATYATTNAAVLAAAATAANVTKTVDWFSENWLTGNGKIGVPANNGNQDWAIGADGSHLDTEGSRYMGRRWWAAISDAPFAKA